MMSAVYWIMSEMSKEQNLESTDEPDPSSEETRAKKDARFSSPSSTATEKSTAFAPKNMTQNSGGFVLTGVGSYQGRELSPNAARDPLKKLVCEFE